jgi:hypothetical protein
MGDLLPGQLQAGVPHCSLKARQQNVDGLGLDREEVEIARESFDIPCTINAAPPAKTKSSLEGRAAAGPPSAAASSAPYVENTMVTEPRDPSPSDVARQDQLVPEPTELLDVDVPPHVVIVALTQNLLVNATAVPTVLEVVLLQRTTPPDTQR